MTEPAGGTANPAEGQEAREGRRLSGPARHALTVLLLAVVVANVILLVRSLGPPPLPDTSVHLRTGDPVPLYRGFTGSERIHWLEPGSLIDLGDITHAEGSRYPVHVTVDGSLVVEGCVDAKDVVPEDVERVRKVLSEGR